MRRAVPYETSGLDLGASIVAIYRQIVLKVSEGFRRFSEILLIFPKLSESFFYRTPVISESSAARMALKSAVRAASDSGVKSATGKALLTTITILRARST
jgi:hypothetical protein